MKLFIDANVLISVLNKEFPLFNHSARILSLAGSKYYQLYTSPTCFAIAYYFAEKRSGSVRAKEKIATLSNLINVALYEELDVKLVAANKKITDFEDGLVYMAAKNAACKYIITENIKDFYFSDIKVLSCKSFLHQYLLA